jgi:hypothetical protein
MAEKYVETMMDCYNKFDLTEEDLNQMLQRDTTLDTEKKKCMYACVYKATGMVRDTFK